MSNRKLPFLFCCLVLSVASVRPKQTALFILKRCFEQALNSGGNLEAFYFPHKVWDDVSPRKAATDLGGQLFQSYDFWKKCVLYDQLNGWKEYPFTESDSEYIHRYDNVLQRYFSERQIKRDFMAMGHQTLIKSIQKKELAEGLPVTTSWTSKFPGRYSDPGLCIAASAGVAGVALGTVALVAAAAAKSDDGSSSSSPSTNDIWFWMWLMNSGNNCSVGSSNSDSNSNIGPGIGSRIKYRYYTRLSGGLPIRDENYLSDDL